MSLLKQYKKRNEMSNEEKALEKDYIIWCEMIGDVSDKELNKRYKKNYLLQ